MKKIKATTQQKKAKLRREADKLYQQIGRIIYKKCLVCGKPSTVLHHYFHKGSCSVLRFDFQNGIPLCQGCHFRLHNGVSEIHNIILEKKGKDWLEELEAKKRNLSVSATIGYYEKTIKELEKLT